MFLFIWTLLQIITIVIWFISSFHVLFYYMDEAWSPKPWPLKNTRRERRLVKWAIVYAYAPTVLIIWIWKAFKGSSIGIALIKWLDEKI